MKNSKKKLGHQSSIVAFLPKILFIFLLAMIPLFVFSQTKTITGNIVDANGQPIIGATVMVKGTSIGTVSDMDGSFTLSNVPEDAVLQISYIGYATQEIPVAGKTLFKVVLQEETLALEELVVVGYGVQKKSDLTGALSRITEKDIKERPIQNPLQALQGKAPGIDVTTAYRPGEVGKIRIRGNRSITASNDPLYVIDGIPLVSGSMADINPNDIESIEVLKDASATAIYGSRAANGVVLIQTKKGTPGKVSINYDGTVTFNQIHSLTDWMGSGETLDWQRSAYINGGTYGGSYGTAPDMDRDMIHFMGNQSYMRRILATAYQLDEQGNQVLRPATPEEKAMGYADQVPVYNSANLFDQHWPDLVTRTGITNNHQISLSSGSEKSKIYMSLAALYQESPMIDQDYQRYTATINGDVSPLKWLKAGTSLIANYSIQNYGILDNSGNTGAKDSYGQALAIMPYAPAYDEKGNLLNPGRGLGPSADNVLLNIENAKNERRAYSILSNTFAEVNLTSWLKYRMNLGAQFRHRRNGSFYDKDFTNPIGARPPASEPMTGYDRNETSFSWVLENLLYMNKEWNDIHSLNVTLLQSAQKARNENLWVRSQGLLYSSAQWYSLAANSIGKPHGYNSGFSETALASYMGRINYSLMNKYLFTATGRWDGASQLAEGNKWDFFPSLAVAWKMEEEPFLQNIYWINQMKIRFGWGVTGNSAVSPYSTKGSLLSANQVFNNKEVPGAKAEVMPNYSLGWEKTSQINVGLDFGFLNNRISGSFEYYNSNTSDLLLNRSIPAILGYVNILANVGKTQNTGVEITLSGVPVQSNDFSWQIDLNWGTNKEKIVELAQGKQDDKANGWFIGHPIQVFRDYEYDRLWQDTEEDQRLIDIYKTVGQLTYIPGQTKVVDQQPMIEVDEGTEGSKTYTLGSGEKITLMDNGFGKINDDDAVILGSNRPKWVGGITNTLTYKNWQFNCFIHARVGNLYYGLLQTYGRRVEKNVWSPTNTKGKYPQPTTQSFSDHSEVMNYAKGSMVAVRNIALSYTFTNDLTKRLNLSNVQIYGQVLNPFIFGGDLVKVGINPDDVTGWETKSDAKMGGQTNNTALLRSYVIGLRVGF
jgi:TonB-linked SusC/RagA family outer membrane protein